MAKQYATFAELPEKCHFSRNGNAWVKRSNRTAYLPAYDRTFYIEKRALCVVNAHSRLPVDYFKGVSGHE